jgi:zinc protease
MRIPTPLRPLLALVAALGLACSGVHRPPGAPPAPSVTPATGGARLLPLDPALRTGRLANGLTWYVRPNGKPEKRAELWLVVDAGSMQEDDDQRGLAHFVEHMAFNGTRHFAKQELIDYLERIGMRFGPDINAYTSFDETVYTLTVPTDDAQIVDQAFLILEDWAHGVLFEGEEIDKERGVVLEEWRQGRGADARLRDKQLPVLFHGSRYAERLPIGDERILLHAPHDALRRFYADWYRPDLMAVIAVGDFDPAEIVARIERGFGSLPRPAEPADRGVHPVPDHAETLTSIETDPEATTTEVSIYYKREVPPDGTVADYRRILVEGLYHAMLNDRLDELRQRADPPFLSAWSGSGRMVRTREVAYQSAVVEEQRLAHGLEALLTEVERVDRHGFTATELERTKRRTLRGIEQAWRERDKQDSSRLASEIVRNFLVDEPMPGLDVELELAREAFPGIGLDEVNGLAREWITERNRVILASAPRKDAVRLPTVDALTALFEAVEARPVEPWVDQVRDEPLVGSPPAPGTVVARSTIAELDVTEWRLSNGVRVVLKPTDFKNDEVLLSGFSWGGTSLVSDADWASAEFASAVLSAGGLGRFDSVELEKVLAGTVASASVGLGETEETAGGRASPEDLRTMFELLYLSFTAPRKDEAAFGAWLQRTRAWIENRRARPETVFSDRLSEVLSQSHPRRRPISEELLDAVDLDRALAIHRERFADVSDFTFVLVGNFDPAAIEPLVTTYLGGLPAGGRSETWRDVGVRTPAGVHEFDVRAGLEPKSQVRITFTGDAVWSRETRHDIASLAAALRIRLREVLREDMGGTYGVGVSGSIGRRPREEYALSISFGCAPERVDSLVAAALAELAAFQASGPSPEVAAKVREGQTRQYETDLRENGFWRSALASYYREELDPRLILAYPELVASVTPERLREAARLYVDTSRYVKGVLYPEQEPPAD